MKIFFIGATGMIGKPVAKQLINAGHQLTLMARNVSKMQKSFPGAEVIKGDVFDVGSLEKSMAGNDVVYLNLSIDQDKSHHNPQPEKEGIANIVEAARKVKIQRIAYLSAVIINYQGMNGFNWWAFDIKHKAIDVIKNSGITYSIFYPSTFFETLDRDMLRGNKLMIVSGSVAPMWFISGEDYGKQVVKALEIAGDKNQEYIVQGEQAFTFEEAANEFMSAYKERLKKIKVPFAILKFLAPFSHKLNYGMRILDALNHYPEKFQSEKTWADLGKPQLTLKEYANNL